MKAVIKRHGGKFPIAQKIIPLFPRHSVYVEPFAGALGVLLKKPFDGVSEIVNDLDGELTNFWSVLADEGLFEQFKRKAEATPLSQVVFEGAALVGSWGDVDRAVDFFVIARQSRQALGKDFVTMTSRLRRNMNEQVSAWLTAVDGLAEAHERLRRVAIFNTDAVDVIRKHDGSDMFTYCDPPYVHSTRTAKDAYAFEMGLEDHQRLLDTLAVMEGKFLLSGYDCELYREYEDAHGWTRHELNVDNKSSSSKIKERKIEVLWRNYA